MGRNIKAAGIIIAIAASAGRYFLDLPDFVLGLAYGIAISILILSFIPQEKIEIIKNFKKRLLRR